MDSQVPDKPFPGYWIEFEATLRRMLRAMLVDRSREDWVTRKIMDRCKPLGVPQLPTNPYSSVYRDVGHIVCDMIAAASALYAIEFGGSSGFWFQSDDRSAAHTFDHPFLIALQAKAAELEAELSAVRSRRQ